MPSWREVWIAREFIEPETLETDPLSTALRLDGYDSPTAGRVTSADFVEFATAWAQRVGFATPDSVYEVGSGSGAFLATLHAATGSRLLAGCDLSPSLVEAGRVLFPMLSLDVADARDVPIRPRFDHVVSFGVFLYLPSLAAAEMVLRRMQDKAFKSVSVLDVPDLALRSITEDVRRRRHREADHERDYAGLDRLYFDRAWFRESLPGTRLGRGDLGPEPPQLWQWTFQVQCRRRLTSVTFEPGTPQAPPRGARSPAQYGQRSSGPGGRCRAAH